MGPFNHEMRCRFGSTVLGGDTSSWRKPSVCLLGSILILNPSKIYSCIYNRSFIPRQVAQKLVEDLISTLWDTSLALSKAVQMFELRLDEVVLSREDAVAKLRSITDARNAFNSNYAELFHWTEGDAPLIIRYWINLQEVSQTNKFECSL